MRRRTALSVAIAALTSLPACATPRATRASDLPAEHRVGWLGCGNAEASSVPTGLTAGIPGSAGARTIDVVATQPAARRAFALAISVESTAEMPWALELMSGRTSVSYGSDAPMVRCEAEGASLNPDATLHIRSAEPVVVILRETGVAGGRAVRVEPGSMGKVELP